MSTLDPITNFLLLKDKQNRLSDHLAAVDPHEQYLLLAGRTGQTVTTPLILGDDTDNTTFEADGSMQMNGAATVFVDLIGSITAIQGQGPGVSIVAAEQTINFTASADLNDYAWLSFQLNHNWKFGSVIQPHLHWEQTSANTPNWLMRYRWQKNGAAKTTAWSDYKCNTNAFTYTSGTLNQISHGAGITPPSGYSISDIIQIRVFRDTANVSTVFTGADPATGTHAITSVDIHYELDGLGSRSEYSK